MFPLKQHFPRTCLWLFCIYPHGGWVPFYASTIWNLYCYGTRYPFYGIASHPYSKCNENVPDTQLFINNCHFMEQILCGNDTNLTFSSHGSIVIYPPYPYIIRLILPPRLFILHTSFSNPLPWVILVPYIGWSLANENYFRSFYGTWGKSNQKSISQGFMPVEYKEENQGQFFMT